MFSSKRKSKEKREKLSKKELGSLFGIYKKYIGRYWFIMSIGVICLLVTTGASLIFPMIMRDMVNAELNAIPKSIEEVGLTVIVALGLMALAAFFRIVLFAKAGENGMARLRADLFEKLISLPIYYFEKNKVGDLTSRISNDVALLRDTLSVTVAELFRQLVLLVGGVILLFSLSAELSITMLSVFPIIIIFAVMFGKAIKKNSKLSQEFLGQSTSVAEESFHGISTVKTFVNEALQHSLYKGLIKQVALLGIKTAYFRGALASFIISGIFGAILLVMWRGAVLVNEGIINFGDLIGFIVYTLMIGAAVGGLGDLFGQLAKAAGAAERLLDIDKEIVEDYKGERLDGVLSGDLKFDNVAFSYPSRNDISVLSNISFNVKEGEKLAIIGKSGAGKSTIAHLLMRMYEGVKGEIIIGGKSIDSWSLSDYRKQIGIVPQEIFIFSGTIRENIAFGSNNISEEKLINACKKANALEFIEKLPEGLDTVLGERGINLSGGQKQRVAIARTILKDPKILLLDEATSSLDTESEFLVQEALDKLMEGRTTIIIAHRLTTIKNVEQIIVLEDGNVVESGTPEHLLEIKDGYYKSLLSF